jgi:hypothetical protein
MIEVKHNYKETYLLKPYHLVSMPGISPIGLPQLKEFLEYDILDAESDDAAISIWRPRKSKDPNEEGLNFKLDPLADHAPGIQKQKAEQAIKNLSYGRKVDHVFYWGSFIMNLFLDDYSQGAKVRIYTNRGSSADGFEAELLRERETYFGDCGRFIELGFEVEKKKERGISPYWWDFYGLLDKQRAIETYGKRNVREV